MPARQRLCCALMSDVTSILEAASAGDPRAAAELLPLVYGELRKLANARLAQEKPGQTLQATALVHEAYLRLVKGSPEAAFNSRGHFFAAAAEAMRRILIEQARRRKTVKRGGDLAREELAESAIAFDRPIDEMLAVDEVLDQLAAIDAVAANLVKLRFFLGLNMGEAAAVLGISVRSATDIWAYARAWLHQKLDAD
jgi:RNA polymerase sigma factor (TIGR02999 family)